MFIYFPIGVEEAEVDRVPWVTIGIAVCCFVAFVLTWVIPGAPDSASGKGLVEILEYWKARPYLTLPETIKKELNPRAVRSIDQLHEVALGARHLAHQSIRDEEQAALGELVQRYFARTDDSSLRRFSLVAARGWRQIGWLSHMFLHWGWIHILFNLFFLYLSGPMLEDIWGRPLFTAFYIFGGLAAAAAQYSLDTTSTTMMLGASGAIAACMGGFTLRYAARKVRFAYFVWFFRYVNKGVFSAPAWACGLLWVAREIWNFLMHGNHAGVAFMAHIGGFGFGLGVALVLKATRFEEKYIAPRIENKVAWVQAPEIFEAQSALAEGDKLRARALFEKALAGQSNNRDALIGLARLDFDGGNSSGVAQKVERVFASLNASDETTVWQTVEELGPLLDPQRIRPALAYRVAAALEKGPDGLLPQAELFYVAAAAAGGTLAAKSLIRAAEIRLEHRTAADVALNYARRGKQLSGLSPELVQRLAELETKATQLWERASPVSAEPKPAAKTLAPQIVPVRLLEIGPQALVFEVGQGNKQSLDFKHILGVGAGIAPLADQSGPVKNALLIDLIVSWGNSGDGPKAVRLSSAQSGIPRFFPRVDAKQAFAAFIRQIVEASGARMIPSNDLVNGQYLRFSDVRALDAALYEAAQ